MFKRSEVKQLFPVFVWVQELEDDIAGPLNEHLREQAFRLKPATADSRPPGTGWQTRNDLQTLPEFAQIAEIIQAATQKVFEFLRVAPTPYEITGCWMNVTQPGAGHPLHGHPNNYLSGVYYVTTPKDADHIIFDDFRMERQTILPHFTERVPQNLSVERMPVSEGSLIMFPAWLPHSVEPNPTGTDRVSLSFNIMFSDFTQALARPIWSPEDAGGKGDGP